MVERGTPARLDLEGFLGELRAERKPLLFVANPGNAGDALIGHSTFEMFDRLGLAYECPPDYRRTDPAGRVVICCGGGNLVPFYHGTEKALRWAAARARRVVLLPHTIDGHDELLGELGPEVELICREPVSFEHVRRTARRARCHLADDMAFFLDARRTVAAGRPAWSHGALYARKLAYRIFAPSRVKTIPSPWKLRRGDRLLEERLSATAGGERAAGTLHAFRTDVEKTAMRLPPDNLDLAEAFSHGTKNPAVCRTGAFYLLRYLDTFEAVRTNRLHTAIAAALLGKDVEFHPNAYYKNRAVFEFSVRDRFPAVRFAGGDGGR